MTRRAGTTACAPSWIGIADRHRRVFSNWNVEKYRRLRPASTSSRLKRPYGLNFLIGAQHSGGLFGELKVGAIDSPDITLTIGDVFR